MFNWIAILTLPVWGIFFFHYLILKNLTGDLNRAVLTGRKWIGEL